MTEQERLDFINSTCNRDYKSMEKVEWLYHSMFTKLPEDFIREFSDKVEWNKISRCQQLSEDFIKEFSDKVYWEYISYYQNLSEGIIREFADKVNWDYISEYQRLSEDFIREFADKVNWFYISIYQKLSEDFIREFSDKVNWYNISQYQQLSEDFIREFQDKVELWWLSRCQRLSEDFIREYKDSLDMRKIEDNWIYKDTEFLKQQVIDTGLYECYDDYFIAYKGIRSDRYSKYNYQYKYLPNQTYESWCDCSNKENSFGLSVWTEEGAREYCNQLVVKVKVNYEDVGRVVHEGGKIRCRKITILD
jgi:hypothetical protein